MDTPGQNKPGAGLLAGVFLVSAATLAVEVLQTRLYSYMLWHHLTYMVVTVTLLGFAAGGALLALWPRIGCLGGDPGIPVSLCASLFGLSLLGAFALLTHHPLDTLEIEKDRSRYFLLFLTYAYLIFPFLFSGLAVAVALQEYREAVHRVYLWNLLGSAIGSFLFVLSIRPLGGPGCLFAFVSLGGLAALAALPGRGRLPRASRGARSAAFVLGGLATLAWPFLALFPEAADALVPIRAAPSKAQTLYGRIYPRFEAFFKKQDPEYRGTDPGLRRTIWTPLCRLDAVPIPKDLERDRRDREDPEGGPRGQVHVFQDGDAPTVIWGKGYAREHEYDRHFYGLGYRLVSKPRVLVIGPGGGNDVETALHFGAVHVDAVDINGDTLRMVREDFGDYTGGLYDRPEVRVVHSEGRSYLRREGGDYDLIQMSGTDTYAALSSGSYIFSESYLYTAEALEDLCAHLGGKGVLSIIRFRFEPPRECLKLVGTAAVALRRFGIEDARRHVLVIDQEDRQAMGIAKQLGLTQLAKEPLRYALTLIRRTPFSKEEVDEIRRALPPLDQGNLVLHRLHYAAGTSPEDPGTEYGRLLDALGKGGLDDFLRSYPYRVEPATDDKPFFFNFYSWSDLEGFGGGSDEGYAALTGSEPIGLYILAALLVQTLAAALLLVILPLFRLGFLGKTGGNGRLRVLAYFGALGLAYLLVEIATIQKYVLYLGHPTYSLTVGLASFLFFSGLGSAWAGRLRGGRRIAVAASFLVVALLLLHALVVPRLLSWTLGWPEAARILIAVATLAPIAVAMGMPFPTGLGILGRRAPGTIPWAFGINGTASVLASILSIILAMEGGFTLVLVLAAGLYLLAGLTVPRPAAGEA